MIALAHITTPLQRHQHNTRVMHGDERQQAKIQTSTEAECFLGFDSWGVELRAGVRPIGRP